MSAALLRTELANLAGQSKKRNAPLRTASEASIALLDSLIPPPAETAGDVAPVAGSSGGISAVGSGVAGDGAASTAALARLAEYPEFVTPFLLACSSANAKACASALQCLQVLASARAISPERLHELLGALTEAAQLGSAIQLKILQLLPVLYQNCSDSLRGPLAAELLGVSAELLGENKAAMVHNAAYATLQQLITGIFDRAQEQARDGDDDRSFTVNVKPSGAIDGGDVFQVNSSAHDAAMVLLDLCDIADRVQPSFVKFSNLTVTFTLELLELTLTNHAPVFHSDEVFGNILRQRITPLLVHLFTDTREFALTLRTVRIFYLLLRRHLDIIHVEAEVILSLLGQATTRGPQWRRILCLELFQGVFLEFRLVVDMSVNYPPLRPIIKDVIENFSKSLVNSENLLPLATSVPGVAADAKQEVHGDDAASLVSVNTTPDPPKTPHTLTRHAVVKVPLIDLLEKTEPPRTPKHYPCYLLLICINAITEGLSRWVIRNPTDEKEKIVNLDLVEVLTVIETPLVNCFTIFLGAAMELELYKGIVRSVQRTAHTAGILGLSRARDDYLKLLVQFSQLPHDIQVRAMLLPRNALCVRALFNLGFALGNKLGDSWDIIVDCIGALASQIGVAGERPTVDVLLGGLEEYKPIEIALHRMLDSTVDLDNSAVFHVLKSLGSRRPLLPVHLVLIEYIARVNADRLAAFPSESWDLLLEDLLSILRNKSLDPFLRSLATNVLNDSIFATMDYASSDEAYRGIIGAVAKQIETIQDQDSLGYEIQLGAASSLNRLLEQFGSRITVGWDLIFEISSSVFQSSATNMPPARRTELLKVSFHSLELICTDFLDNLPDACVLDLITALDNFARQGEDINTAFTGISLFWTVCDHIMRDAPKIKSLTSVQNEADLTKLAKGDQNSRSYALWMLALLKLANIANEPQHQKKTGAVQIFFRLIDAHHRLLPSNAWNILQTILFPKIMSVSPDENIRDVNETISLIVKGLGSLYASHLIILSDQPAFGRAWKNLLDFFDEASSYSTVTSLVSYETFNEILGQAIEAKSDRAKNHVWEFWIKQDPGLVKAGSDDHKRAVASECALVAIYPKLAYFVRPHLEQQERAIEMIYHCASLYFSGVSFGKNSPVLALQDACMDILSEFDVTQPPILILLSDRVSVMATLPYEETGAPAGYYDALSHKCQELLLQILDRVTRHAPENPEERRETVRDGALVSFAKSFQASVTIMRQGPRKLAMELYLELIKTAEFFCILSSPYGIVTGGRALMEGSEKVGGMDTQGEDIDAITKFFELIQIADVRFRGEFWDELLIDLARNSLLYTRGLFTKQFFDSEDFPVDLDAPPFYGTVEPPHANQRQEVSYHCLAILRKLASSDNHFAPTALRLYEKRAKMVLYQYIGDARLRGNQPMPTLLRDELLFVLEQLIEYGASPSLRMLMTRCMNSQDRTLVTLIQQILLT